jgi:RNA polymerase sigma-70 factor (ECF subfamily)
MIAWVVIFSSDPRRRTHCRHVTKILSSQPLLFSQLTNRDARNPFRFCSYVNSRVPLAFPSFLSLFAPRALHNSFAIMLFRTLLPFCKTQLLCFHTIPHSLAKTPGGGGTTSSIKRLQPYFACLRLFLTLARIAVRMSATISCLTSQRSSFFGGLATPCRTLFFSTLMGDEAKSIARGLQKRDPDLLDRLIEQYQYRLFRYLVYVTGNKERAEDFFQETWIRVLERGHQYDGKSKFEAWLFAIARHLVIDWQRSKKPQSLDTLIDPEQEHPLQLANENDPSPLHQVLSQETEENVQAGLQKIPAIYREVLVLRFQEELQIEEMAGVLSVPLSTVKSRLYRGLEALRGALQGGAA